MLSPPRAGCCVQSFPRCCELTLPGCWVSSPPLSTRFQVPPQMLGSVPLGAALSPSLPTPQVLFVASDLGLFEALAPGPLDATTVARALGSSPRGMRLLLDACTALGLVQAGDGSGGEGDAIAGGPAGSGMPHHRGRGLGDDTTGGGQRV